ncbi:FMN-binding negative transcriptional regulator [Variovorax sp. OV329]|uniref:FMN-binding negative transcriptional regulator n=1 Tax=Variovorax sp. OV329 TaxID=1882825 RepID=UPI0008E85D16|nr:FMN-binding negative transcriptional regulator [Variovorax sp. OV329]SFM63936.1 negative transcriptional regulator, PaiB family [Variovorax sp. OV329]
MYLPPQFNAKDRAVAVELMRANAFASLITTDDEGLPFVSHLPLVPEERGDGELVLWGHCAKPNAQWRHLQARPQAVVTFLGPHAYMSPSVYPDLARVPTWNYLAVHCTVQARLVETPPEKDALLKRLIGEHEPPYAQQWRDLGEEFQLKLLAGIVGFELRVTQLQCKIKINQHRPESHVALHARYASGSPDEQALAGWMRRLGLQVDAMPSPKELDS